MAHSKLRGERVMSKDKYSDMNPLAVFGFLANTLDGRQSPDGDTGVGFPRSDAEDLSRGARFIPYEVTRARRAGQKVIFINECGPCCWYWRMPDGTRIYHFDQATYIEIARHNFPKWDGTGEFRGDAGPCPNCGNPNTWGPTVKE